MTTGAGVASWEQQSQWSELPGDLVDDIIRRFTKVDDVVSFQAACKPWRPPRKKFRQSLSWLTCSPMKGNRRRCRNNCRHFLDITRRSSSKPENKIRHVDSAKGHVARGFGSTPSGWQLIYSRSSYSLLDPFTGDQIPLPPISSGSTIPQCFATSADEQCIVMICYLESLGMRNRLAFCHLGRQKQQGWTWMPDVDDAYNNIENIVFWKGRFHALDRKDGRVMVCDLDGPNHDEPSTVSCVFLPKNWDDFRSGRCKLVVSPEGDELMLVSRMHGWTTVFSVHKINEDEQRWDEVEDIGEYALFLDEYKGVFVSTGEYPECVYVQNCVYYLSDVYSINSKKKLELSTEVTLRDARISNYDDVWIFPSIQ